HNRLISRFVHVFDLPKQMVINKWTLFKRSRHTTILLFFLSATDNKLLRLLVVSSLVSLCFPTPGRAGMTTSGGLPFASTHRVIDWIHRDSAYLRATAPPACRSCL